MNIVKCIVSAVFPNKCISCGEIIDDEKFLCAYCEKHIEKNNLDDLCLICGFEKENCVCNYNVYRFEKLISVFKNEGIAQRAYYSFKFGKKQHYVKFFAEKMAEAVNTLYRDIKFDYICAVPAGKSIFLNSNYDHCNYLCTELSKFLKIPYANKILYCKGHKKQQHKLSIKNRLTNVNGKFYFNYRINGATVLLVDDIRTTGATLDECAKMLLYAGADKVYCVTALATVMDSKKKIEN